MAHIACITVTSDVRQDECGRSYRITKSCGKDAEVFAQHESQVLGAYCKRHSKLLGTWSILTREEYLVAQVMYK
jgi:hypothetical protein